MLQNVKNSHITNFRGEKYQNFKNTLKGVAKKTVRSKYEMAFGQEGIVLGGCPF